MCDVVFARKRTDTREGHVPSKRDAHSKSSILEKFARTNHREEHSFDKQSHREERAIDKSSVVAGSDRWKKADCSEPSAKVARSRVAVAGTSIGIFNNIRRSAFMHRSTALPKDSSRESVVDKVFVETDFFSDTPNKAPMGKKGAELCRSDNEEVKSMMGGYKPCIRDRGSNSNTENHEYERSSGKCSAKSSARKSAPHSSNRYLIESNPKSIADKKSPRNQEEFEMDGLEARKVLIKKVVAAWHTDTRYCNHARENELEAAAATEYRACRKVIGLIASETFHDDGQDLRDASISAADARLCRSNLTRVLQHAQQKILQAFVCVQEFRSQLDVDSEQVEGTDEGCQASMPAHNPEGQIFHSLWIQDDVHERWRNLEFESMPCKIDTVDKEFTLNENMTRWASDNIQSDNWQTTQELFNVDPFTTESKPGGRRALNPRRLREGSYVENARQHEAARELLCRAETAVPSSKSGKDAFPWLQGTVRKLGKVDPWISNSLGPAIDESLARDMCTSIEMGIISDSMTLPPELLSP